MRIMRRVLPALMCALLMLVSALGEESSGITQEAFLSTLPVPTGETLIPPAYPVPDYVLYLLDAARAELGYTEEKNGATKYGAWAGDPTAEWCAEFLCWCVNRVDTARQTHLLNQVYPNYSASNTGRNWFLSQGRYIARKGVVPAWGSQWYKGQDTPMAKNSYVPQPGDWVFFSTGALGDTTHVAMVEFCTSDAQGKTRVHVIEGNNPDAVARNAYPIDNWAIQGYGTVYDLADIAMRFGNSGAKVKALQEELVAVGLMEAQYTTGRYGAITEGAIKELQRQCGIAETGVANHETQLALHALAVKISKEKPENWVVEH